MSIRLQQAFNADTIRRTIVAQHVTVFDAQIHKLFLSFAHFEHVRPHDVVHEHIDTRGPRVIRILPFGLRHGVQEAHLVPHHQFGICEGAAAHLFAKL